MKNLNILLNFIFTFLSFFTWAQTLEIQPLKIIKYGPDSCYARGISILKNKIYTANSNGMVYSINLKNKKVNEEFERKVSTNLEELRDIHVFNKNNFITMQSNDQSGIYSKIRDSISSWIPDSTFFDAMDFNSNGLGVLIGDPKNDYLQVYLTKDFGENWTKIENKEFRTIHGEAGFAASGTVVQVLNDSTYYLATGGMNSHLLKTNDFGETWVSFAIPFKKSESSGTFSMHFWSELEGICVGGDYTKPNDTLGTCFITHDGGKSWFTPKKSLSGYRSCVIKVRKQLYACGFNGIDVSEDFGLTWNKISDINSCAMIAYKKQLYVTTTKGKIAIFNVIK
jgi:photosystem II stability/assembly factor-like uncharacterized protein